MQITEAEYSVAGFNARNSAVSVGVDTGDSTWLAPPGVSVTEHRWASLGALMVTAPLVGLVATASTISGSSDAVENSIASDSGVS